MPTSLLPTRLYLPRRDIDLAGVTGWPRVHEPDAPVCANPERRRACKHDLKKFKRTYFPRFIDTGHFHGPFLDELQRMALSSVPTFWSVAAPRGIGKTVDAWISDIWKACYKHRNYFLWICKNAENAEKRIKSIKGEFLNNDLLMEDFPEICGPIRDFGGDPRSAHPYIWKDDEVLLPNNAYFNAFGWDGGIRGQGRGADRPDDVKGDDLDDDDIADSAALTKRVETVLKKVIPELGEQGGRCSHLLLFTVCRRGCIADRYTDPKIEHLWRGKRFPAMVKPPENLELWEKYMELCKEVA